MSFADSINNQVDRGRGQWVTLAETGDVIVGTLLDIEEIGKEFEGVPVLAKKSGKQRIEWVITLEVDERDDADDTGIRKVRANEGVQIAIKDFLRDNNVRFPATWGGKLAIGVKKGKPAPTSPVEEWSVRYTPPSPADLINAAVAAAPAPAADPLAGLV